MQKTIDRYKFAGLLLAGTLAGCATTPPQEGTKAVPHRFSTNISPPAPGSADTSQSGGAHAKADPAVAQNADANKVSKPASKSEIYAGTGVFVKPGVQNAPVTTAPTGDEVMLNFEGADLREVVKAIVVDFLGETYIMDTRVQGVVSLHTTRPIPRSSLLSTLETLLRMNGAAIIKESGMYKVVPAATAARGTVTPQLGAASLQGGYSVQVVPLKFISAKEMLKILEPFVSDASAVRIDEVRNLMILAGTALELRHLLETVDMFDIDWLAGMSVGLFTLQSVDVKTAVADLDKVFGAAAQSPLSGILKLVPIERLNAILVVTPQPKYLEQAKVWVERMDRAGGVGGGTRLFVYPVQNGQAEKMAALLSEVFGKSTSTAKKPTPAATLAPGLTPATVNSTPAAPAAAPTAAPAPPAAAGLSIGAGDNVAVAGDVRVIADKDNNALLILASPSDYEKIEAAVRKLDVVPRQVLVDVTIAEVKLEGNLQFGLQAFFGSSLAAQSAPGQLFTPGSNGGTLNGASGASFTWSNARAGALITMLQSDSRSKIISSPHLMVTDNHPAKMQVGDTISIPTQTITTTGTTNSFSQLQTGVILTVTPHINAGGLVTLEINQDVTQPTGAVTVNSVPPISTRSVQSTVVVKSGETMAMGGLIQESGLDGKSGLPFLSQIPVLGGLFGNQTNKADRTELVILITPRVVENSIQAEQVTSELRKKLSGLSEIFEKIEKKGKSDEKSKINK